MHYRRSGDPLGGTALGPRGAYWVPLGSSSSPYRRPDCANFSDYAGNSACIEYGVISVELYLRESFRFRHGAPEPGCMQGLRLIEMSQQPIAAICVRGVRWGVAATDVQSAARNVVSARILVRRTSVPTNGTHALSIGPGFKRRKPDTQVIVTSRPAQRLAQEESGGDEQAATLHATLARWGMNPEVWLS